MFELGRADPVIGGGVRHPVQGDILVGISLVYNAVNNAVNY